MEDNLLKILKHFPHNICFVYYLVDSILDGDNGHGCFRIENEVFDLCKAPEEQTFWKENIRDYKFLFTAAMLKYYSYKYAQLQDNYESFIAKYYGRIANESKRFFSTFSPPNKKHPNIIDFLYSESDFALTRLFDNDNSNSAANDSHNGDISIIKKKLSSRVDDKDGEKKQIYGKDYIYVSMIGGKYEELKYDSIRGATLCSFGMIYTSRLCFDSDCFIDKNNVISFASTDKGFVYIVKDGKNHFLRSQGFMQIARLIRKDKKPIIVKAYGLRVAVLMSDGTLTSNCNGDISGVRNMWFDENGDIKTE